MIGLALDLKREVARRRCVADGSRAERLGEQLDRRQRCAELVADVGHEVAAHALHAPQRPNVLHRHHDGARRVASPVGGQRHRVDGEDVLAGAAQLGLAGGRLAGGGRLPAHRIERRAAECGDQAHPPQCLQGPLGELGGRRPGAHDPQPRVDDEQHDPVTARDERVERGCGQPVDHSDGGGEKAYPTPRTVRK
ncbi:MAG TPA: hypothetical protein VFM19_05730 [Candidatus Limnocylindria bacterium]|nr:hypothetical protein [Candidatus Limnocylindria bacterium]